MQSQYAAASNVPLIKSPSLRVPKSVSLPPDIHPLPDNVNAYFVYPYTLEPHILTISQTRRQTLQAHATRRQAYLAARAQDKERRKKEREEWERQRKLEELRKVAPGFDGSEAVMVPIKRSSIVSTTATPVTGGSTEGLESLVDGLARLSSSSDSANPL